MNSALPLRLLIAYSLNPVLVGDYGLVHGGSSCCPEPYLV